MFPFIILAAIGGLGYYLYEEKLKKDAGGNVPKTGTAAAAADIHAQITGSSPFTPPSANPGAFVPVANPTNAPEVTALNNQLAALQASPEGAAVANIAKQAAQLAANVAGNVNNTRTAVVTTHTDGLNIRSEPTTAGIIMGKAARNSVVNVTGGAIAGTGSIKGWVPCNQGLVKGFASLDFLTFQNQS